ncbi:MAG: hypothetical protein ACPGU7_01225 [Gammaproteobacteria bacterium]
MAFRILAFIKGLDLKYIHSRWHALYEQSCIFVRPVRVHEAHDD